MVVCKFFQQGNCRFGQYCKFEHVNFNGGQGVEHKLPYGEGKSIVLGIAEEVLTAERGGQWLLSSFGPFKEQASIPGMEDVSPEEIRWEIYQAQKNGNVEQTKNQYERLCQEMIKKREALKNPTLETAEMLEKLHKHQQSSNFSTPLTPNSIFQNSNSDSTFAAKIYPTATGGSAFGDTFKSTPSQSSVFTGPTATGSAINTVPFYNASSLGSIPTTQKDTNEAFFNRNTLFSNNGSGLSMFSTMADNYATTNSIFGGGSGVRNSSDAALFCKNEGGSSGNLFTNEVAPMVPSQCHQPMINEKITSMTNEVNSLANQSSNCTILGDHLTTGESFAGNSSGNIFNAVRLEQQHTTPFNIQRTNPPAPHLLQFGQGSVFGRNSNEVADANQYSNEDELTSSERMLYLTANFELGKIPTTPPTIEMR
uniref:Nucleoporin NUP42 n=1 Tax=Bracon brevicornis TaxID=1563983 RepID=A0A6V7JDC3_9HYME